MGIPGWFAAALAVAQLRCAADRPLPLKNLQKDHVKILAACEQIRR